MITSYLILKRTNRFGGRVMVIGVLKELKNNENRVSITPAGVYALVKAGHKVIIEKDAGAYSGIEDNEYASAGAAILQSNTDVYGEADIIVKVKEPLESEYDLLREGQTIFTYLHLATKNKLAEVLIKKKITAVAYETVQLSNGSLPLLSPMSEIAGRMAVQVGANLLQKYNGGSGILLGGVPGVLPAEVVIVGGGVVGANAAKIASGMGAQVKVVDIDKSRLSYLDDVFSGRISTLLYSEYSVAEVVKDADLLIGAVLVPGARAPKTVKEDMVKSMRRGSVIVDVAIDQGGSIETVDKDTSHDNPTYEKFGVIHYSVSNMPGAVPRTSTFALTGATLQYLLQMANKGVEKAMLDNTALMAGLNTYGGYVTCRGVAQALNTEFVAVDDILHR